MRILIGTDGSDDAVHAAARGIGVLAAPDVITVVCVVQTPAVATSGMESGFAGGMASDETVDAAWITAKEEADRALDRTATVLPAGVSVERRVETGDAGTAICRVADELDADVIVIGSRGRGAFKRALLGSVSTHVANNSGRPVVVVGEPTD